MPLIDICQKHKVLSRQDKMKANRRVLGGKIEKGVFVANMIAEIVI